MRFKVVWCRCVTEEAGTTVNLNKGMCKYRRARRAGGSRSVIIRTRERVETKRGRERKHERREAHLVECDVGPF